MRADKMGPADDRPDGIGAAGAIDQQGAARHIIGKIGLPDQVRKRKSSRSGKVPFMPLLGSHPKVVGLIF